MSIPLVSVIMTVHNCEKFIEESLKSIFNQTFKDFEIIIYNDASTDRTMQIIIDFLRDNTKKINGLVNIIYGGKNVGCGEGRNRAISISKSSYLAIQDGDDISYSDRLEKEVEFMERNPSIFCVGSWADLIDEEGSDIGVFDYPPADHNSMIEYIYGMKNPIIDPSSMFKRDIFNSLGGYNVKWYLVPDLYLWVSAMIEGYTFANIPQKLISYRRHGNSVMAKHPIKAIREHRLLYDTMIVKHKKEVFLAS